MRTISDLIEVVANSFRQIEALGVAEVAHLKKGGPPMGDFFSQVIRNAAFLNITEHL
jgi:hypothetical protein